MISPLANATLFHIGPAPITSAVAVTWGLMAFLVGGAFLATRRLSLDPSPTQSAFELIVDTVDGQIRDTMQTDPARVSRVHRHPVRIHLRRQLVDARSPGWSRRRRIWRPTWLWPSSSSSR